MGAHDQCDLHFAVAERHCYGNRFLICQQQFLFSKWFQDHIVYILDKRRSTFGVSLHGYINKNLSFLPRDAMLACYMCLCLSICLSVRHKSVLYKISSTTLASAVPAIRMVLPKIFSRDRTTPLSGLVCHYWVCTGYDEPNCEISCLYIHPLRRYERVLCGR